MEAVEKTIEKPISSDAEESNESATETPSVGGTGGKESSNSDYGQWILNHRTTKSHKRKELIMDLPTDNQLYQRRIFEILQWR